MFNFGRSPKVWCGQEIMEMTKKWSTELYKPGCIGCLIHIITFGCVYIHTLVAAPLSVCFWVCLCVRYTLMSDTLADHCSGEPATQKLPMLTLVCVLCVCYILMSVGNQRHRNYPCLHLCVCVCYTLMSVGNQ